MTQSSILLFVGGGLLVVLSLALAEARASDAMDLRDVSFLIQSLLRLCAWLKAMKAEAEYKISLVSLLSLSASAELNVKAEGWLA